MNFLLNGVSFIFGSKRKRDDDDTPMLDCDHASASDPRRSVEPSGDATAGAPVPLKRLRVSSSDVPSSGYAGRPSALVGGNSEESGDSTEPPKEGKVCQLPEEDAGRVLPLTSSSQNRGAEGDKVDNGSGTEPKGAVCELPRTSSRRKQGYHDGSPSHRKYDNMESADATEAAVDGALCQQTEKGGVCAPLTSSRRKDRWGDLDGAPSCSGKKIVKRDGGHDKKKKKKSSRKPDSTASAPPLKSAPPGKGAIAVDRPGAWHGGISFSK